MTENSTGDGGTGENGATVNSAPDPTLIATFWEYERALMANDLDALDRFFAPGLSTMRGDAAGLLIGHGAISDFRRGRGGSPERVVLHVELRMVTDAAALVIAVTAPSAGGRGQQTQLWQRTNDGWRIAVAHVSQPAPAIDRSVWRAVGTPLVAGARGSDDDGAGPLAGETVAVKDLFEVAGFRRGGGVPAWFAEAEASTVTAPAVIALLEAGADVIGIAQTDEFAYSIAGRNPHYGTPPNPAVIGGTPGGSSSGPASAVALGQASVGLGTDTGGSIRVPASYQGLWGLRTTHGSVSANGLLPLAPGFDTVGWMTRTAPVLRRAAAATLDAALQRGVAPGFVIAPALLAHVEPSVASAFATFTAAVFPQQSVGADEPGAGVENVDLGDIDELFFTFRTIQSAEAWREHGPWILAHPGALGDDIAGRFAAASRITSQQEQDARVLLVVLRSRLERVLGERMLLLPSASSVALPISADAELIERTRQATLRLTCIAGLTGRPALSVPLLWIPQPGAATDAPVGVCLIGPRFSDLALIDAGEILARLAAPPAPA